MKQFTFHLRGVRLIVKTNTFPFVISSVQTANYHVSEVLEFSGSLVEKEDKIFLLYSGEEFVLEH